MNTKMYIEIDSLEISCDYQTASRVGAIGTFQVESVTAHTIYGELDFTSLVDQGKHYYDIEEVAKDLNLSDVDVVEI